MSVVRQDAVLEVKGEAEHLSSADAVGDVFHISLFSFSALNLLLFCCFLFCVPLVSRVRCSVLLPVSPPRPPAVFTSLIAVCI